MAVGVAALHGELASRPSLPLEGDRDVIGAGMVPGPKDLLQCGDPESDMVHGSFNPTGLRDALQFMLKRRQILDRGTLARAVTPSLLTAEE